MSDPPDPAAKTKHESRVTLLWDVLVFQFKLVADGLRDVLLSPVSIVAAILGVVAGGDDPYRYFRSLLRLGHKSEAWLNLFGYRASAGTSDELIEPVRTRVVDKVSRSLDGLAAPDKPSAGPESPGDKGDNLP